MRHWLTSALAFTLLASTAVCSKELTPTGHPLTLTRYAELGMPATDRAWSLSDLQKAQAVIEKLKPEELPLSSDKESSPIIDRLTDTEILKQCSDKGQPLSFRLPVCTNIIALTARLMTAYLTAAQRDPAYADDLMRLLGYTLRAASSINGTNNEFIATLDPQDPTYESQMQGVGSIRAAITGMIGAAIATLRDDRALYPEAALGRFAIVVAETYPAVADSLPAMTRAEFERDLRGLAQNDSSPLVREALAKFDR